MKVDIHTGALARWLLASACTLFAGSAVAVEPANFQLGPVHFTPTAKFQGGYIDNLFRSENNEVSTWATRFTPKLRAWMQKNTNIYSLSYTANALRYSETDEDDYTDQIYNLDVHHEFNVKNVINLYGEFFDGHEERGTGLSEGNLGQIIPEPVEYERARLGGNYTYGSRAGKGRLMIAAEQLEYDYQNYRALTQFRDRDQNILTGTFYWAVAPKTDLLIEAKAIENEYDKTPTLIERPSGTFDSEEYNYVVGVDWEASAKTSGTIKLGVYDRSYKSSAREDDDGFQWSADLEWKPRSYSRIFATALRFTQETNGLGNAINTEEYVLRWIHDWNNRSRTSLMGLAANDEYKGSDRDDDRYAFEAKYNYAMRRWLDLGLGYRFEERDSEQIRTSYTRNSIFLDLEISL
jgi:polysaccharide biosynthesis protein VpsM